MTSHPFLRTLSTLGLAAAGTAYWRFRREMREAGERLEAGGTIVDTAAGPVEYGREGEGEPVLMIHGAGGGYDQGMMVARDMFEPGHDLIAPSRFGYLRTPLRDDNSPAAQADAHAVLLETLGIGRAIVAGVSAGAPSAIELALRHPERVSALILAVPRAFDPEQMVGVDASAPSQAVLKLIETASDFAFWLAMRVARPAVVRFLGVPPGVDKSASPEDRERVGAIMRSILPLSRRIAGIGADSAAEIKAWPLERIRVPTLIISAEDDLFRTLPGARFTAERIEGAELRVLASGGHLMVGRGAEVRAWVADFLRREAPLKRAA